MFDELDYPEYYPIVPVDDPGTIGGELAEPREVEDDEAAQPPRLLRRRDFSTGFFGPIRDFAQDIATSIVLDPGRTISSATPQLQVSRQPGPRPIGGELAEINEEILNPADTTTPNGEQVIVPFTLFDTIVQGVETLLGIDLPFIGIDKEPDRGGTFASPRIQTLARGQPFGGFNEVPYRFEPTRVGVGSSGCGCVIPKAPGQKISDITCIASQFIGRRISSRTINSMVREIGFEKARGALGLSVQQLGSVVAHRSRRRSRGITAADKRTSLRTLRSVKSLNKAFGIHSHRSPTRKK